MKKLKNKDWCAIINKIQARGMTQKDIEKKTGVTQDLISNLKLGKTTNPSWKVGNALLEILKGEK